MGRPKKYNPGDKLGPYNHILVKYIENSPKGVFQCSYCGKEFVANRSEIVSGRIHSCGCHRKKYQEGDILGSNKHKLLKRLNGQDGLFKCGCCGKTFTGRISGVAKNIKTSCGCLKDLSGRRFGKLLVLENTGKKNNQNAFLWRCKCDCGEEVIVSTGNLQSGHTQSCGCLRKESVHKTDISNQRFGKLVALYPTEKRTKNGTVIWHCKCDCGNEKDVPLNHLISNHTMSCGCQKSNNEIKIQQLLDEKNISYIQQYSFSDCKNPKTDCLLFFDFYLPDYNICLEIDGEQHFVPIEHWGGEKTYQENLYRDNLKTEYCKNNNIKLIRIPYYEVNKWIKQIKTI